MEKRNSESPAGSDSLLHVDSDDKYVLLRNYTLYCKIQSRAFSYSEAYYRQLYKWLSFPLIILSAVSSLLAGLDANAYYLMSLSLCTLILVGFNTAINPKDKEARAAQVKTEYGEISANCKHFIYSNNHDHAEIKAFSSIVHEQMNIWAGLAPPLSPRFLNRAKTELAPRSRKHSHKYGISASQKK